MGGATIESQQSPQTIMKLLEIHDYIFKSVFKRHTNFPTES